MPKMTVTDAVTYLVTVMKNAGVDATIDPPKIHPPGAWITARRLQDPNFRLARRVVADCYLIARDNGIPAALDTLDGLLNAALAAVDADHRLELDTVALDEVVTLPHGGGPLPAFRISVYID